MALAIPVNSTTLYATHWRNGSVFPQLHNNFTNSLGNFTDTAVYLGNSEDQGLQLTILENNVAQLTINATGFSNDEYYNTTISGTLALTETLFSPNVERYPVTCVYPLSGQYDTLSRALFYVLMVFSLVFRRHLWISVAALGTAMTYAGTTAIHVFAMVGAFGFKKYPPPYNINSSQEYGDIDIIGTLPILSASAIMVTPILMWSTTVRKFDAQAIIVWWGLLIFAALAIVLCVLYSGAYNQNALESFAICTKNCLPTEGGLTLAAYQNCSCMDFCGTLGPSAPLRNGANMVAWLAKNKLEHIVVGDTPDDVTAFDYVFAINLIAVAFIVIYGAFGIIISRFRPDEVRNGIFRFFNADLRLWIKVIFEGDREHRALTYFGVQEKANDPTIWRKIKYIFAKMMATNFSLLAGATAIICPIVFITSVVANELGLQIQPVSEHSDAVGAWGQWVGASLVLIAAIINKWGESWVHTIKIVVYTIWRHVTYSKKDRQQLYPPLQGWTIHERIQLFGLVITSPFVHAWCSIEHGYWTVKTTLHFFGMWWRDTATVSQMRGDKIEAMWENEMKESMPTCHCHVCTHDNEKEETKEEEIERKKSMRKPQSTSYQAVHGSSKTGLTSDTASIHLSTLSVSSLPQKTTVTAHGDESVTAPAKTTSTTTQVQQLTPADYPLPAPRGTFPRRNTDHTDRSIPRKPVGS